MDRVGLTVTTDQQAYYQQGTKYIPPRSITLPNNYPQYRQRKNKAKEAVRHKFNCIWPSQYKCRVDQCLRIDDYEGASVLWHGACEKALLYTFDVLEGQQLREKPPRGTTLPL